MPPANIEADPFFLLLTDALRAGPKSPQWQEAIEHLKAEGIADSDEYKLLTEVRDTLESGRDYREIRPGPGFTRKVMQQIESEPTGGKRSGVPTATIIAVLCGILVIGALGYLAWRLVPREPSGASAIDDLESRSSTFVETVASANFDGAMPQGWHAIGALPLETANGLRAKMPAQPPDAAHLAGGGVVCDKKLDAAQPFAADVLIRLDHPTPALLLEAFVTSDPNFSSEKATSSRDLVWQLQGREQHALLNGIGQSLSAPGPFKSGDTIRLIVAKDVAIIELVPAGNGSKPRRLWAGAHELGASPRYMGVRFLQTGAPGPADLSVQQIKITAAPQSP